MKCGRNSTTEKSPISPTATLDGITKNCPRRITILRSPATRETTFDVPINPWHRDVCSRSVAVGLEGSRQEATPLPSTTFDIFSRCVPLGTLHPRLAIADAAVFSCSWRQLQCAAPVTHQDQGRVTSRSCARRLPLASRMPQKTFGSLPCPIVYSVQIAWLPHGSTFSRAHGRGVAQLSHAVAGPLAGIETGTNQIGWLSTNSSPSLQSQPPCGGTLSQTLSAHQRAPAPA